VGYDVRELFQTVILLLEAFFVAFPFGNVTDDEQPADVAISAVLDRRRPDVVGDGTERKLPLRLDGAVVISSYCSSSTGYPAINEWTSVPITELSAPSNRSRAAG